jgi:NADH dehydrogenase
MVDQNSLINFVLVGGGPTGVELAGALAEMKKPSFKRLSRSWYFQNAELIQSGDRILNTMSEKSSAATQF